MGKTDKIKKILVPNHGNIDDAENLRKMFPRFCKDDGMNKIKQIERAVVGCTLVQCAAGCIPKPLKGQNQMNRPEFMRRTRASLEESGMVVPLEMSKVFRHKQLHPDSEAVLSPDSEASADPPQAATVQTPPPPPPPASFFDEASHHRQCSQ